MSPALGGLRRPRQDSINTAWQHPGFRGYADHMQNEFRHVLGEFEQFASLVSTSVLGAEAGWRHCHRRLLAEALIFRGASVRHILSAAEPKPHQLSDFAREGEGGVIYPGLL